ncbi:MAG: YebC/PmpR family DNA-binding transcriptional regulator [Verrucomicrobiota bacterium]
MSGHSKWANIKHKKGLADAKKGQVFSKIDKEMMIAVRAHGADPSSNLTLRQLMQKARSNNMPADNIERAIKRGTGDTEGEVFEEVTFEGYAHGGVAVVVQVLTNNRNRSAAEVRHVFTRHGASFAGQGSVMRSFQRKGHITVEAAKVSEDQLMELVLEAGAEDLNKDGDQFEIVSDPAQFMNVVDALNKAGIAMQSSEITLLPGAYIPVSDKSKAGALIRFVEDLEDLDDVQNVYMNFDIAPEILEALAK